jgi:hypothetical protein
MIQRRMRSVRKCLRLQWHQGFRLAFREESESRLSTGRRLSQVDRTNAQDEVSSGFQDVARRRSSSSSFVHVLRMAPGSEGALTEHNVMGSDDGRGSEYIPR